MAVEFIADIGANHGGDLWSALFLIREAARVGANAVKFQHFRADHIVSAEGFADLPAMAHQRDWSRPVHQVYREAETPWAWTPVLAEECERAGVEFMSTPYDLDAVDHLNPFVRRWKIGSGDITYRALLEKVAATGKPVLLSTGASTADEVCAALDLLRENPTTVMQCNTDYSGGDVGRTNLRALAFMDAYPVGLSDHTRSLAVVLGAVALGAAVIERHFMVEGCGGPDARFSMQPDEWREMVEQVRELESAMGDGVKKVEPNEVESRIVQRRCWRAARDLPAGHVVVDGDVVALRPCPEGALTPMTSLVGCVTPGDIAKGTAFAGTTCPVLGDQPPRLVTYVEVVP